MYMFVLSAGRDFITALKGFTFVKKELTCNPLLFLCQNRYIKSIKSSKMHLVIYFEKKRHFYTFVYFSVVFACNAFQSKK